MYTRYLPLAKDGGGIKKSSENTLLNHSQYFIHITSLLFSAKYIHYGEEVGADLWAHKAQDFALVTGVSFPISWLA